MDSTILQNDQVFSIDDLTIIHYRKITDEELKNNPLKIIDPFTTQHNNHLIQALSQLNEESNQAIFAVSAKSSELASYLNILDIKINLLADAILAPENKRDQLPQKIILNQNGLWFGTNDLLYPNDLVVVKFMLTPSYQIINLLARIVDSSASSKNNKADSAYEFWTYVSFENVNPIQDQWIARHIFNKQTAERRKHQE